MAKQTTQTGGVGFLSLLAIVFITLKLIGTIDWSWWWVLAPMWIPPAIVLTILAFARLLILLADLLDAIADRRSR